MKGGYDEWQNDFFALPNRSVCNHSVFYNFNKDFEAYLTAHGARLAFLSVSSLRIQIFQNILKVKAFTDSDYCTSRLASASISHSNPSLSFFATLSLISVEKVSHSDR